MRGTHVIAVVQCNTIRYPLFGFTPAGDGEHATSVSERGPYFPRHFLSGTVLPTRRRSVFTELSSPTIPSHSLEH